jgi:DNA (cytosine-5)-methyltransferase 1
MSIWKRGTSGIYRPRRTLPPGRRIAIDLFAGAGGMSLGMERAGYWVLAAVECDRNCVNTYITNLGNPATILHTDEHPGGRRAGLTFPNAGTGYIAHQAPGELPVLPVEHVWMRDVQLLTGQEILAALGLEQGEVDLVCGGPPCPGFSVAGKQDVMDPRNALVFDFARLVLEIRPKAMVMENVPGILKMLTPEGVPVVDALCRILADGSFGGYDALRKSLLASSGAGAMLRRDQAPTKPKRSKKKDQEQPPPEEALF